MSRPSSKPSESSVERRLTAELELARAVQGLLVHELGNPLQSLLVLVELSRDDLVEAGVEGRSVQRLDRALDSINRLRKILLASSRARASLAGSSGREGQARVWGPLLDNLIELIGERLTQLRAELDRLTAAIDARPLESERLPAAVLAALIGACEQIRDARRDGVTLELHGREHEGRACLVLNLRAPEGPVAFAEPLVARIEDLLGDERRLRCRRDGRSLVIG